MEDYLFPWELFGTFDIWIEGRLVSGYLSRAFIRDTDLLKQKVPELEMNSLRIADELGAEPWIVEVAKTADGVDKNREKTESKQNNKKRRKGVDLEEFWQRNMNYFVYKCLLENYGDALPEESKNWCEQFVAQTEPEQQLDVMVEKVEIDGDWDKTFVKHCELTKKSTLSALEKKRTQLVKNRALTMLSKIEKCGLEHGFEIERKKRNDGEETVEGDEQKMPLDVFDDIVYDIRDGFRVNKSRVEYEDEIADESDEQVDEYKPEIPEDRSTVSFEFDASKERHLIASHAHEYYGKDVKLRKYLRQRYRLFSRLDEGILMDWEGWFSVTPERIAQHIADRMVRDGRSLVIDAFTGVGGNAIQFALHGADVIAIDMDPTRLKCARENAKVYGVQDHITFVCADYFDFAATWTKGGDRKPKIDAVFLSPPWGGPGYLQQKEFDLAKDCTPDGVEIFDVTLKITKNIAYYLPRNTKVKQLIEQSAKIDGRLEVEQSSLNTKIKAITVYYGDLIASE